jgi:hypothetical protein
VVAVMAVIWNCLPYRYRIPLILPPINTTIPRHSFLTMGFNRCFQGNNLRPLLSLLSLFGSAVSVATPRVDQASILRSSGPAP